MRVARTVQVGVGLVPCVGGGSFGVRVGRASIGVRVGRGGLVGAVVRVGRAVLVGRRVRVGRKAEVGRSVGCCGVAVGAEAKVGRGVFVGGGSSDPGSPTVRRLQLTIPEVVEVPSAISARISSDRSIPVTGQAAPSSPTWRSSRVATRAMGAGTFE